MEISNLPWVKLIDFSFPDRSTFKLVIIFDSRERESGFMQEVMSFISVPKSSIRNNKNLLDLIRRVAKHGVTHEIDECLMFKNKRIFDPHKRE